MIKANELRIGNLIYLIKDRVYECDADAIADIYRGDYEAYGGIHLTESILLKAGFNRGVSNFAGCCYKDLKFNKVMVVPLSKDNDIRISMPHGNGVMTITEGIKFVHQLQNLYFAVAGEELAINLKEDEQPK